MRAIDNYDWGTISQPPSTVADLKDLYRLLGDDGDCWGTALSAWFNVADYLYATNGDVPEHWGFRPGAMGCSVDPDDVWFPTFEDTQTETLERWGDVLMRYCRMLRTAGLDY